MISWALITDVIDYSEIKSGIREDGLVYALYSFARKLGQAGAAGFALLGVVLWFWYPLHKKQVEENVEKLREKRNR